MTEFNDISYLVSFFMDYISIFLSSLLGSICLYLSLIIIIIVEFVLQYKYQLSWCIFNKSSYFWIIYFLQKLCSFINFKSVYYNISNICKYVQTSLPCHCYFNQFCTKALPNGLHKKICSFWTSSSHKTKSFCPPRSAS